MKLLQRLGAVTRAWWYWWKAGGWGRQAKVLQAESRALEHYTDANQSLADSPQQALLNFRSATGWWRRAGSERNRQVTQGAIWGVLISVILTYAILLLVFPRPSEQQSFSFGSQREGKSWWEHLLSNDRPPQASGAPYSDMRQWWDGVKQNRSKFKREQELEQASPLTRKTLEQRWEKLLRRYGRWGPLQSNTLIDHYVIAGDGLSRNAGDYEGAVRVLHKGLSKTNDSAKLAELYHALANAYYDRGYELRADGLATYQPFYMQKAAGAYLEVVSRFNNSFAFGNLGWVNYVLGNYAEAEFYSRSALMIDANLLYVHLNLGITHIAQGQDEEAYSRYLLVVQKTPSDEVLEGGIKDLKEMLRANPSRWPLAHVMLGMLAIAKGDFTLAKYSLDTAKRQPNLVARWQQVAKHLLQHMRTEGLSS